MAERAKGTIIYGMMGVGKTTLGKGLAEHLGQEFNDTDALIFERFGTAASELAADPDKDFGEYQAEAILAHNPTHPEVIATGGSVATFPDLVTHLRQFGVGIFIDVDPEALDRRLPQSRKMGLYNPDGLSFPELYERRADHYRKAADLVLSVEPGEIVQVSLANLIKLRQTAD